nr:reverse transcriptase domain-containing protein [Tanacetum cinerariifolium]
MDLHRNTTLDRVEVLDRARGIYPGTLPLDRVEVLAESKFKTPMLDHQDNYMMKAQVHVSKSFAISDEQPLPKRNFIVKMLKHIFRGRLLASFQDHEHEGGDTRSQGGIKDNELKIKIQDLSMQMINQKNSQEQGSKIQESDGNDKVIKNRVFNVGDRVLLFNSRLKIFSGKLKTRWSGPFTITKVFPYGTVELSQANGPNFKVNGHRVKHYFGGDVPPLVVSDLQTFPMDQ